MPIAFNCPHCGHAFEASDTYAGQSGPCAACEETITVPGTVNLFADSADQDPAPPKRSSAPLIIGILVGGLVVMVMCGGVLAALLLPAVSAARETARLAQCKNNEKVLGLAMVNYDMVERRAPLASSRPVTGIPGNGNEPYAAGYSWTVSVLPWMEDQFLFDRILDQDREFELSPFDPENKSAQYVGWVEMKFLHCPSNPLQSELEESEVYEKYQTAEGLRPLGTTNYIVLAATHLTNSQGPLELFDSNPKDNVAGNGIMVFPKDSKQGPRSARSISFPSDGASNTILICESKEQAYNAWIDGQATWGVGAWPKNTEVPSINHTADGSLGWLDKDLSSMTSILAAQEKPELGYLEASRFGGSVDRRFGPSSAHVGIVVHLFADGSVRGIKSDIDRNLYLRLITHDGGEAIDPFD